MLTETIASAMNREPRELQDLLADDLRNLEIRRPAVSFLLGTDEHISRERRVALTPAHVERLRRDLEAAGLRPVIYALAGAGERAEDESGPPFRDADYRDAGARVVSLEEASVLDAIDVVHALKEPTEYESRLSGPLIRIGALHLASKPSGLCHMLVRKNFAAILDGGTVGDCSYLKHGGDRTPIVGSMSRFAGSVAARKLVKALLGGGLEPGRVIVVGGGIAGTSAIQKLGPVTRELIVVDPWEPTRQRLEELLPTLGHEHFRVVPELTKDLFGGAIGVVFAHRSGAKAAEKVCHFDDIRRMPKGAAISDIAIDQGGSIAHDDYREEDNALASLDNYQQLLGDDYSYYAETNMPREEPHEASVTHGDSSLPYITALLALCAREGSATAAIEALLRHPIRHFNDAAEIAGYSLFDCVTQDLRNGLQLVFRRGHLKITDPDIEKDDTLAQWVRGCARGAG